MSVDSRLVYENVRRSLEFIARDRGAHWQGRVGIGNLLYHLGIPQQNLGCVLIMAVCALRFCEWPPHIAEALARVPLNGHCTNELQQAFWAVEAELQMVH